MMAMGPLVLLGAIAFNARTMVSDYIPVEYGPKYHGDFAAYRAPVRAVLEVQSPHSLIREPEVVDRVANVWLRAKERGTLRDLPIAHIAEVGDEGVRHVIDRAQAHLMDSLYWVARTNMEDGRYSEAADRLLKVVAIGQINKFSTFERTQASSITQNRALQSLSQAARKLSPGERVQLATELAGLRRSGSTYCTLREWKRAYEVDMRRHGVYTLSIEASRTLGMLTMLSNGDPQVTPPQVLHSISDGGDEEFLFAAIGVHRARLNESEFQTAFERTLRNLAK